MPIKEPFGRSLARDFGASDHPTDFEGDASGSIAAINEWVAFKTHNKISALLPADCSDRFTRLLLVNAIYFSAQWKMKFDQSKTFEGTFYGLSGEKS